MNGSDKGEMMQAWHSNHVNKYQFNTMAHKNMRQLKEVVQRVLCVQKQIVPLVLNFFIMFI